MADTVGYFSWLNLNGKFYRRKCRLDREPFFKTTKDYYASIELIKFPLSAEEFDLSFDELAKKYPLPDRFKDIAFERKPNV